MSEKNIRRRIQVVFDDRALATLDRLRCATGQESIADVIRDALGFYDWARRQCAAGNSVAIVDHRRDRVREFILPFQTVRDGSDSDGDV